MRVLVVIVNYRSTKLVVACLESLARERQELPDLRVMVVDNPGGDDSLTVLRSDVAAHRWHDWVGIREMPRNGGFAYGVNAGVQPALTGPNPPDAFLLLNPDTYVRPGAIAALTRFLETHPEAGMVGSRLEDEDGTVQHSRFRFPSIASEIDNGLSLGIVTRLLRRHVTCPPLSETPHEIDWLSGACQMIRRDVFDVVGPFDEGYFLYYEELDFARRARGFGIRSWYVPESRVVHLVGRTTGVGARDGRQGRMPTYWFDSRNRYFLKHHGPLYKSAADLAFAAGKALWHCLRVARRRRYDEPPRFLRDFVRYNFWFTPRRASDREGWPREPSTLPSPPLDEHSHGNRPLA